MNRLILAALFAASATAAIPSFAQRGGGHHGGAFNGAAFNGAAFHGRGFAGPVPFRGFGGFPAHRGFFPGHPHHRSAVFIGAGFGFPAYAYSAYYPAYYAAPYPVYAYPAAPVDLGPVMRLYCADPAGYFPAVRDCNQEWVQVPQEEGDAPR